MGTLDSALAWLASLPQGALVGAMALLAAAENVFPPIPADVMVAFGAFVAARGGHSALPAFIAVWLGNMAGVAAMYRLGQRYGTGQIERRFHLNVTGQAGRLSALHGKYATPHVGIWIMVAVCAIIGSVGLINVTALTGTTLASNIGTFIPGANVNVRTS